MAGATTTIAVAKTTSPTNNTKNHPSMIRKSQTWVFSLAFLALIMLLFLRKPDDIDYINNNNNNKKDIVETERLSSSKERPPTAAGASLEQAPPSTSSSNIKHNNNRPIRQISILGERNSGTRWTYDHISACFNYSIPVERHLTRYKHWFQYKNASKYPHDTLVLAQFRNPYDWLKAMEHVPHHSPNHLRTHRGVTNYSVVNAANDWELFLSKPWTMARVGLDLQMQGDEYCQEDFYYKDLVSCAVEPLPRAYYNWTLRYSEHQPFYEMQNNGSGNPYANILELRSDKIRNFLGVASYPGVADVWVLQYEYLVHQGTEELLKRLTEWTGIIPNCTFKPPQNRKQRKSRRIAPPFARHVRLHLNWTVESYIGYDIELHREQVSQDWR